MKKRCVRRCFERYAYNRKKINFRILRLKKSFDEVYKILNGGNNRCK